MNVSNLNKDVKKSEEIFIKTEKDDAADATQAQTNLENPATITYKNHAATNFKRNRNGSEKKRAKKLRALSEASFEPQIPSPENLAGRNFLETHTNSKRWKGSHDNNFSHKAFKKFRGQESGTYVDDPLAIAVVAEDYPRVVLVPEHLTLLRGAISREIDGVYEEPVPRFRDSFIRDGAVIVKSADDASLNWLIGRIGSISLWEGGRLKVVSVEMLRKKRKAVMWVPGPPECPAFMFARLEKQNPGLNTANWRVYADNVAASREGKNLILSLPESNIWQLRAMDFKLYLGLGQVTIKIDGLQTEETDKITEATTNI